MDNDTGRGLTIDDVLADYRGWLFEERGLAAETLRTYTQQSKSFLTSLSSVSVLGDLFPADVIEYVAEFSAAAVSTWTTKTQITALRSFLRFAHVRGLTPTALAPAVPGVAGWTLSDIPRALPSSQVEALLTCHNTATVTGLRDKAVLTMLATLGLRGAEVAGLELADIDWQAGLVTISGKGSRVEQLPLPATAGTAIADYVMHGRPVGCDGLFLTVRRPFRKITPGAVRQIMRRACQRAGIDDMGAHRLRHTLATDLLRAGASLLEIGQVLRHRSPLSTAIYAKVDHHRLRQLARPWPQPLTATEGV